MKDGGGGERSHLELQRGSNSRPAPSAEFRLSRLDRSSTSRGQRIHPSRG